MAKSQPKVRPQIVEEASSWFIDFNEGVVDASGRDEFNAWLRRSPEHVRAYLQISAFWEDADVLDKRADLDLEALIARAQKEGNVVPLDVERVGESGVRQPIRAPNRLTDTGFSRPSRYALAATLLLFLGALSSWYFLTKGVYSTDIGEQRSITLEDGSSLELNSRSRVKVQFTDRERAIELVEGQALFRVARNANRPFRVRSGATVVQAVGTAFDVYKKSTGTVVTVVEGRVAVTDANRHPRADRIETSIGSAPQLLSAGEQVTVTPAAIAKPKRTNIAKATAWTEKKLVFEATPLKDVVEEFNRYNRQQLVIRDVELYDYHVSGVFPSTDSGRMIEFLKQRFGVQMDPSDDEVEISRAQ